MLSQHTIETLALSKTAKRGSQERSQGREEGLWKIRYEKKAEDSFKGRKGPAKRQRNSKKKAYSYAHEDVSDTHPSYANQSQCFKTS